MCSACGCSRDAPRAPGTVSRRAGVRAVCGRGDVRQLHLGGKRVQFGRGLKWGHSPHARVKFESLSSPTPVRPRFLSCAWELSASFMISRCMRAPSSAPQQCLPSVAATLSLAVGCIAFRSRVKRIVSCLTVFCKRRYGFAKSVLIVPMLISPRSVLFVCLCACVCVCMNVNVCVCVWTYVCECEWVYFRM